MTEKLKGVFNSPIETGLRCLTLLSAGFPNKYDLNRIVFYDYVIVHSGDIVGGPQSLHPDTPHRSGEILVRRPILESGIQLMVSRGLIDVTYTKEGILYSATEYTTPFLDSLQATYILKLIEKSYWVIDEFDSQSMQKIQSVVNKNLASWGGEFLSESVVRKDIML